MTNQNNAAQAMTEKLWRSCVTAASLAPTTGSVVVESSTILAIDNVLSALRAEDAQASDERAAFEAYVQKRFGGLAEPWDANAARYPYGPDQARWEAWRDGRAALASAPVSGEAQPVIHQHGFAADNQRLRAINESLDKQLEEVMTERDEYHDVADKLAEAIADHLLVEIGEHSSSNCPWMRALDAIQNAAPQASEAELKEAAAMARSFGAPDMADALEGRASEADALIDALGQCRDAFPIPDIVGSKLDFLWQEAMSDPSAVPAYIKARAALSAQPGAQKGGSDA